MKKTLFLFLLSIPVLLFAQQTDYSRVKIYTDTRSLQDILATGIEITEIGPMNQWFLAEIPRHEIDKLAAGGFHYEIVIHDLVKYYTDRFTLHVPVQDSDRLLEEAWPQPVNFSLGSCGGFSTVDEMIAQLDLMRSLFPSLITVKQSLSDTITTIEGRPVYYVRISDNPDINEPEPEVLYTGMHHAREPIGMQHLLFYMWYLLENYSSDSIVKGLVDSTELYFVPVFNVDGYIHNSTNNPAGGGMWRKNKRDNGDGTLGVDINRNYGYMWGYDDIGSSPDPESDTYRGTSPFSEPETRMMKYFCEDHNFLIALNYHSYSNLLLYPWGWTAFPSTDNALFDAYATLMTEENYYTAGPGSTTIYPTNGGSDDWMYGEQTTKPAILAYTPEVGGNDDNFWPVQQRILPLIRENMMASFTAARLAGLYGTIAEAGPFFLYTQSGYLPFEIKRVGMQEGSFLVSVTPLGDAFASVGDPKVIQGMTLLEKRTDSISFQLNNTLNVGDTIRYVLTVNNGYFSEYDTVTRIYGFPLSVFNDDFTNKSNWDGSWNLTTTQYFSPATSITDSPSGNYFPYTDKSITLNSEINLPASLQMILQFHAKWAIEKNYDYVQVSISDNNGVTWTPLSGKYTHSGTANQAPGEPVYDGRESDWVRETISLNGYTGKKVRFRFLLKSDSKVQQDGFYLDDFNISMVLDPTSINQTGFSPISLGDPYPNPASGRFEVNYTMPETGSPAQLIVSTMTGTEIIKTRISSQTGTASIDISELAAGIYFIRLTSDEIQSPVRKLVVK